MNRALDASADSAPPQDYHTASRDELPSFNLLGKNAPSNVLSSLDSSQGENQHQKITVWGSNLSGQLGLGNQ